MANQVAGNPQEGQGSDRDLGAAIGAGAPEDDVADTNLSAQQLSSASANAMRSIGILPANMAKSWMQVAKLIVAKEARREALGEPKLSMGGSVEENWLFQAQALAAARHVLAVARDGGLEAKGEALGAFRSFYSSLDKPSKIMALSDASGMESNPQWQNFLEGLGEELGMSRFSEPKSGPMMRPQAEPSLNERALGSMFAEIQVAASESALNAAAWKNLNPAEGTKASRESAMFALGGMEDMAESIAKMKELAAQQEAETGLSWREQGFSTRFNKSVDIQLSSMAMTLVALAKQSESDPSKTPKVKAGMKALCSLMSKSEAERTLSWIGGSPDGAVPPVSSEWASVSNELRQQMLWSAGAVTTAAALESRPAPEALVPAEKDAPQSRTFVDLVKGGTTHALGSAGAVRRVGGESLQAKPGLALAPSDLDLDMRGDVAEAWQRPAPKRDPKAWREPTPAYPKSPALALEDDIPALNDVVSPEEIARRQAVYKRSHEKGVQASRALRGFVDAFSPSTWAAKADQKLASWSGSAQGLKSKLRQMVDNGASSLEAGVLAANAATDKIEASIKQKAAGAIQAVAGVLDNAVEGIQESAKAKRAAFVGKVGELRSGAYQVVGAAVLKTADSLPSSFKDGSAIGEGPRSIAFKQVAMLAGALFVGATMAPVAGLLGATVGAVAAGAGFASAISHASKFLAGKAVKAPAALESIGAKLGAKRAAADAEAPRVEPNLGAPGAA